METKMQIFENPEFGEIRSVLIDGEPWLVGKDVATALGYERTADAIEYHVDAEDKGVGKIPTPGGKQNMVIINESGVYALIMGSKLPSAKRFKRWVTSEVLPALRKTGTYTMPKAEEPEDEFDTVCRALQIVDKRAKQLEARNVVLENHNQALERKIEFDAPKVKAAETFLSCKGTIDIGAFAKSIGVHPYILFRWMREDGWLMYTEIDGRPYNIPQQKAIEKGLMAVKYKRFGGDNDDEYLSVQARVTPKGAVYFREVYGDCETDGLMEV